MRNLLAVAFVAVFLAACGTYSYKNTRPSYRGVLMDAPDHSSDEWRERVTKF